MEEQKDFFNEYYESIKSYKWVGVKDLSKEFDRVNTKDLSQEFDNLASKDLSSLLAGSNDANKMEFEQVKQGEQVSVAKKQVLTTEENEERRSLFPNEVKRVVDAGVLSDKPDFSGISCEILNGVGINGIAKDAAKVVKSLGIKVPDTNNHVMYVWIDALCNYITALNYPNTDHDLFKTFWPGIHVVGKDILRFHAVYWPAILMAAGLKPPKQIFAHGWWTNEGQKISKSVGNIINPYDIINKYGLDQIRFFLFREVTFGNDGDFSKKAIATRINADLSNNYGNLVQRILTFIVKNCDSSLSTTKNFNSSDTNLLKIFDSKFTEYSNYMNDQQIDKAIKEIMDLLSQCNAYVDEQAPWSLKKTNPERMKTVLYVISIIIIKSTVMLFPIIPNSAEKVLSFFNLSINQINFSKFDKIISKNIEVNSPSPIFPRIE